MTQQKTMVLTFRGNGEPRRSGGQPQGMLGKVADALSDREDLVFFEVPWPAEIGPTTGNINGLSLEDAVDMGVQNGLNYVRSAAENGAKVALMGYSLGGIVATKILRYCEFEHEEGVGVLPNIEFMLNISNPMRAPGQSVDGIVRQDLYGIHLDSISSWQWIARVYEYADPNDCITAVAKNSPLRIINAGVTEFSFRWRDMTETLAAVTRELDRRLKEELWANWTKPEFWLKYQEALRGITGYLLPYPYGDHVSYDVRQFPGVTGDNLTYIQHAARTIRENH